MTDQKTKFMQVLDDHHQWPCPYVFKFIVPSENIALLTELFPEYSIETRESKNGKYTSVTFESSMCSTKEVMDVYEKASEVPGLMSL